MTFFEFVEENKNKEKSKKVTCLKFLGDSNVKVLFRRNLLFDYVRSNNYYNEEDIHNLSLMWEGYVKKDNQIKNRFGKKSFGVNFPLELFRKVEKYKKQNHYKSISQTVCCLLELFFENESINE